MNDRGMVHFDLNPSNILTDGRDVFAADFGLALCADFDLSPNERVFLQNHRLYDRCYVDWAFVNWIGPEADKSSALSPNLRRVIDGCAPVADVFGGFFETLSKTSKSTPYPAVELEAVLAAKAKVG
jgi:serine/threonine protein kinase